VKDFDNLRQGNTPTVLDGKNTWYKVINLKPKHNIYFSIPNSYMFRIEQFIIGPIQNLIAGKK
jgi:hypothetical protein